LRVIARILEHGFVTPGPERAQRPDEPYRLRFVDGLGAPLQYFVVVLDDREVVVVTEAASELAAVFGDRLVAVMREDRPGRAKLDDSDAPEAAAAAAAAVKMIGGWDESTPITIEVGTRALDVFLEFVDLQWHVRVEQR
jgi:hypothetical protein